MGKVFFQNGKGLRFIIAAPVGFVNAYMVVGNCQKRQNLGGCFARESILREGNLF